LAHKSRQQQLAGQDRVLSPPPPVLNCFAAVERLISKKSLSDVEKKVFTVFIYSINRNSMNTGQWGCTTGNAATVALSSKKTKWKRFRDRRETFITVYVVGWQIYTQLY
jgi:hypothetical protein